MFHIELKKRIPQDRHELSLESALGMYELCRNLFSADDERQSYFGTVYPDTAVNPNPLDGYVVDIHYLPAQQYLRMQMFEHGGAHTPIASIICRPDEIIEMGRYGADDFYKIYRPYLGVGTGRLDWKMVRSDAPRTLTYLDRDYVPVFRNEFERSLTAAIRRSDSDFRAKNHDHDACSLHSRRLDMLEQFIISDAKIEGFGQYEFSPEFIQNLSDNYAYITGFFRTVHNPNWNADDEGKWLKLFFRALDPKTDVNGEVDSDLLQQWRDFLTAVSNDGNRCPTGTDPMSLGGWSTV